MPSYRKALHSAQRELAAADVYPESAQVLMLELARKSSADLYRDYDEEMPEALRREFLAGVSRLKENEPLAYILGHQWFYGRKFEVNRDVLIPRCETEELCAKVLADIDRYFPAGKVTAADIGTGSGEIGITLALEEPRLRVYAGDISAPALRVARRNAKALGAKVTYFRGDLLEPLIEKKVRLDVLVSDPPYIPAKQAIDASVRDYEPAVALFGGEDGLCFYRRILDRAPLVLHERSLMAFEIGYDQKKALASLAREKYPEARIAVLKDIEKKDRMLMIYRGI